MKFGTCNVTAAVFVISVAFAAEQPNRSQTRTSPEQTKVPAKIEDVNTLVDKANFTAYYQGLDGKATVKMTIIDKQGRQRRSEFIILRKDVKDGGDQKYYVYFRRPAAVREMVYIVHKHAGLDKDDDRWLYLPALDLVRRIAAGDKRTSFVGSDFLYEDVSGRSPELDIHELIEATDKFFLLKNVPKRPDAVEFSYYNVTIDPNTYMPMKTEYYDKQGKLYRIIESKKVEKVKGFPTTIKSVALDLKTGSKTEMEFTNVDYNVNLKDIFTERYLRRPPREARR